MSIFQTGCFFGRGKSAALFIAACLVLWIFLPAVTAAQEADNDTYELVLGVKRHKLRAQDEILTNSLLGFQRGYSGYYLPLKGLADLLELYVDEDLAQGTAQGWFLTPDNVYSIDTKAGTYTIRGELVDMVPGDFFVRELAPGYGDIYVRMEILEQIWPLKMEMDFSNLQLTINTDKKLPYELRREREERRDRLLKRSKDGIDTKGFQFVDTPYKLFSPPALDVNTSFNWDQNEKEWGNQTSVSATNDLLGFSGDYQLSFDYQDKKFDAPEDLRMTLTRRAWDHEEPMFLGVREVRLGDVSSSASELTNSGDSGRGIAISSAPLARVGSFDETTIEGTATPGWDVELYRGGQLLDFGTVSDTGQYRFENVPLFGGSNEIKIMLYGPSGQTEERIEEHWVGSSPLDPGAFEYNASIVDVSDNLISFSEDEQQKRLSQFPDFNEKDGYAYNAAARIGVTRWMSVFATGNRTIASTEKQKFATAGTNLSLGPVTGQIEYLKEVGGGHALDTRFLTSMLGWRVSLRGQKMSDFESERVGFGDDARVLAGQASVSNNFSTGIGRIGLTGSVDYEKDKSDRTQTRYQLSKQLAVGGQSYGNRISASVIDNHLSSVDGLANAYFRLGQRTTLRGILDYNIKPHFDFDSISADLDYRQSKKLSMGLDLKRNLINATNGVGANVNYDFGSFLGSLSSNWNQGAGVNVILRASSSFAPFGEDGSYIMSSQSMRSRGALNTHVYLDKNANYALDAEDEPVEDAILVYGTRNESDPADENGFVNDLFTGNGEYQLVRFKEDTTDNPFQVAEYPGYGVQMRPGIRQSIYFPLVESGIIDGTTYFENGNPVPGLTLQLVDGQGHVIKETMTSFDGYYTFEMVKPGSYIVQADPASGLNVPVRMVNVSPDALFAYGFNMKLLENGGLPPSEIKVDEQVAQQNLAPIIDSLTRLQNTLRSAVSGS